MSVLGYDPARYYGGRGPIEAMALGIDLEPRQAALRCNLVTVAEGLMRSYAAGHIPSEEAQVLIAAVQAELGDARVAFHPGVGFRNIMTIREGCDVAETRCTGAHDIPEQPIAEHLPVGPGADLLCDLMERSKAVLADHPINRARVARGELPATQIWLFWPGLQPVPLPAFRDYYGHRAAVTTAVDLLRGLARQAGIDMLDIPGVTDGGDNDYVGQMRGALAALADHDVVVVHVEAPDEAGHSGDAGAKVTAIEQVDALMVPQVTALGADVRLMVLPDHPTPLAIRTHTAEPVPFVLWGPGFAPNGAHSFSETSATATGLVVPVGYELMGRFLS
jgi:2,3-bisphosphoglycerate-independent phosphoglycerate mutase, archaeal form